MRGFNAADHPLEMTGFLLDVIAFGRRQPSGSSSMIRKSGYRFSDQIMVK
jgi:hypothetical protein